MKDGVYTNGVIAVKEHALLGERVTRLAALSREEALRTLTESGFGSGAAGTDGESLCAAEERSLDGFIREYAPNRGALLYLLAPRDYHNAKALVKARLAGVSAEPMLAPEGLCSVEELTAALGGEPSAADGELLGAVRECLETEDIDGLTVGTVFDRALFARLARGCRGILRKLLAGRADRTNILTALRARDGEQVLPVAGGGLKEEALGRVRSGDFSSLKGELSAFARSAWRAREEGRPFTEAERELAFYEAERFAARKYDLERSEPFLYYVFRRRAEIENVRIVLVCLGAGVAEGEIRRRLRAVS